MSQVTIALDSTDLHTLRCALFADIERLRDRAAADTDGLAWMDEDKIVELLRISALLTDAAGDKS